MAEILTPGCAEVKIRGSFGGRKWIMGMHANAFLGASPIPESDLNNLMAAVAGGLAVTTELPACLPTTAMIEEVSVRDVGTAGAVSALTPLTIPGTVAADCQNSAAAAVVVLGVGGSLGFRRPGKVFLPAVPDTFATDNTVTSAASALYESFVNEWMSNIEGASSGAGFWTPVLRSLHFMGHPRAEGITTPILSATVRLRVATQVGRLRPRKRKETSGM